MARSQGVLKGEDLELLGKKVEGCSFPGLDGSVEEWCASRFPFTAIVRKTRRYPKVEWVVAWMLPTGIVHTYSRVDSLRHGRIEGSERKHVEAAARRAADACQALLEEISWFNADITGQIDV